MSKKWSRLARGIKRKQNRKSKLALMIQAAALGFALAIFLWNVGANESGDTGSLILSAMAGLFVVPIVFALCGAGGGVFAVQALCRRESLSWSIPATVLSGLLLFVGMFMSIQVFFS